MPSVVVNLKMKTEADGGRHGPFNDGYSPHLVAVGTSEMLGVHAIECSEWVYPGTEAKVKFSLVYSPSVDYAALKVGTAVNIVEGSHNIGSGVIIEVHT